MPWTIALTRRLPLDDGREIATLDDARAVLTSGAFAGVTHWTPLEFAIDLLLAAAQSGQPADVAKATEQLAIVLSQRGLLADPARTAAAPAPAHPARRRAARR